MPKSDKCACGIRIKAHARKSRRRQLPHTGLKTDRLGYPRPRAGARIRKEALRLLKLAEEIFKESKD